MNGQPDHVRSLMAGSLYMPGVKKGVKRAEQMEEERETETEWADGEVLGRKELFSTERCEDITVQRKEKKSALLKRLRGEIPQLKTIKQAIKQRCRDTGGNKGWKVNVRLARHNNSYIIQPIPPL